VFQKNNTGTVQTKSIFTYFIFHVYNKRFYPTTYSQEEGGGFPGLHQNNAGGNILGKEDKNSANPSVIL
jgi:hypothetical protein